MRLRRCLLSTLITALALSDPVVPIVLELAIPEFVALQRLSDSERRRRFHLPESSDPTVAASRARKTHMIVIIGCAGTDVEADDVVSPVVSPVPTSPGRARSTPP